jgi:Tol biopolymer transport system component
LPHSLYYLNNDKAGLLQVFRVAKDGKTFQQITFEPARVDSFDVSPIDGSVAYGSNNQLLLVDANGAGRRILLDGGAVDGNAPFMNSVGNPVWSPDGKTIAFGHNGLNFYSLDTGSINNVLPDEVDTSAGFPIARSLYSPNRYSPDGTKLLINIGFYEGGTYGVYRFSDNTVLRLSRSDGSMVCCEVRWVPDGSGLYVASRSIGMADSGLGYADASTGNVTMLLPGSAPDTTFNFAAGPQVGRDGKLYFFFNNLPQIPTASHTPLYLVRSGTDGVTGRAQLKPDIYQNINEVLWAPDASLAVIADAPIDAVNAGGTAEIVYPDNRPDVVLTEFAQDMHWGP